MRRKAFGQRVQDAAKLQHRRRKPDERGRLHSARRRGSRNPRGSWPDASHFFSIQHAARTPVRGSAYGFWTGGADAGWHTMEDDFEKADRQLLVRDTRLYVALIWPLATKSVLPFDFAPVAIQMRKTIEELARAAGEEWDFEPTLHRIALFEETARRLRRQSLSARVEDAPIIDSLLMRMSREINPVLYTVRGPYYHDPAYQLPLFPGLRGARELGTIECSSDEAGFIQTELLRESNRIHQALDRAIALGDEK